MPRDDENWELFFHSRFRFGKTFHETRSYGGPATVRITDQNSFGYEYYLTTNRSVVFAQIDGRGSAYKGSNMLFEIYRKIGTVEVEDTIAVTEWVMRKWSKIAS